MATQDYVRGLEDGKKTGLEMAAEAALGRKYLSIEMLEKRVIELEVRNLELLVHNNELLARARKAEGERNEYLNLLDDVSAALDNCVGHLGFRMPPADRVSRTALAVKAREICDLKLRGKAKDVAFS